MVANGLLIVSLVNNAYHNGNIVTKEMVITVIVMVSMNNDQWKKW